jgi:hypothetical protein
VSSPALGPIKCNCFAGSVAAVLIEPDRL